jgi:hypothetical protein
MMIRDVAPNNQNSFKQIAKLLCCIVVVFVMVVVYARHRDLLGMKWVSESILFLCLAGVLWIYRVENCWRFDIDGRELYIRLSYNTFLRGDVTVVVKGENKTYPCWLRKGVKFQFHIAGNDYFLEIKKSEKGSFFICSVESNSK